MKSRMQEMEQGKVIWVIWRKNPFMERRKSKLLGELGILKPGVCGYSAKLSNIFCGGDFAGV